MVLMKLLAVPVVILVLLAGFLTTNPTVAGFFDQMKDKFFSFAKIEPPVGRSIEFSVSLGRHNPITFDRSVPMNITIRGKASVLLQNGRIDADDGVKLVDYRGYGSISDTLTLNGTYESLESSGLTLGRGKAWVWSDFSSLEITNLRIKIINTTDVAGSLTLKNSSTQFYGSIEIFEPLGTFDFNGTGLAIRGTTQKISIPSIGINIG